MVKAHGKGEFLPCRRLVAAARRGGFSLIEVTIAIGVVVFAMIALLGLLSTGLKVARQAKGELVAAQLASSILTERRTAPLATLENNPLPALTASLTNLQRKLLDRSGLQTASAANAYYGVYYTIALDVNGSVTNGAQVFLALTHPVRPGTSYSDIAQSSERYETTTYIRLP